MDKYRNMAFSCYGNISRQLELSEHLKVLRDYPRGQIRDEQLLESLQYLSLRFGHKMKLICITIDQTRTIDAEDERIEKLKKAIRELVNCLDRNHRQEFSEAVELWKIK